MGFFDDDIEDEDYWDDDYFFRMQEEEEKEEKERREREEEDYIRSSYSYYKDEYEEDEYDKDEYEENEYEEDKEDEYDEDKVVVCTALDKIRALNLNKMASVNDTSKIIPESEELYVDNKENEVKNETIGKENSVTKTEIKTEIKAEIKAETNNNTESVWTKDNSVANGIIITLGVIVMVVIAWGVFSFLFSIPWVVWEALLGFGVFAWFYYEMFIK